MNFKYEDFVDKTRKYAFINDSDLVYLYNKVKNSPLLIRTQHNNILNEI